MSQWLWFKFISFNLFLCFPDIISYANETESSILNDSYGFTRNKKKLIYKKTPVYVR